jgi:tetratricopeptide (TPR) repeat protein
MTLVLPERERLIGPLDLVAMPPRAFTDELTSVLFPFEQPEGAIVPSHVARARALAETHNESPTAAARLAQAEQSIGEDERAIAAAQRALTLVRKSPDVPATVAAIQVLFGCGRFADAWAALDVLPKGPIRGMLGARLAAYQGDVDAAAECLAEFEGFDTFAMRGWVHLQRAEWPQAIHALRSALKATDRPTPGVLLNLGYAYAALGSLGKAIRVTKQAHLLHPDSRPIVFNLIAFHRACGDFDTAQEAIKDIQERHPHDVRIHFAEADLRLAAGDIRGAQRVLRRARTSTLWAYAGAVERSELIANLAFVAWRAGDQSRETTRDVVIGELERTEYRSLEIASMLPALMTSTGDGERFAGLVTSLKEANPGEPLDFFRINLALLRCDFEEATRLAVQFARRDIFNANAAAQAIYLLADVRRDYETAIEIGTTTIKRVPSLPALRNNLAYALALADRLDEARDVLPSDPGDSVYMCATAALVDVLSGRIDEGIAGYRRAYEFASKVADPALGSLVTLNMSLAFHRLVKLRHIEGDVRPPALIFPRGSRDDPRFVLLASIAEQEGIPTEVAETSP